MTETAEESTSPFGEEYDYPRGWFMVATSEDLTHEKPHAMEYLGRRFVGYRDPDGKAIVLDGICPHMGANLAIGGQIEQCSIRCPFHDWRFNAEGQCDDIPYGKRIPPKAKIKSWQVDEKNGMIFIWHDPEDQAPDYHVPDWKEYSSPEWTQWKPRPSVIHTQPREVVDNIADKGHFYFVHGTTPTKFGNHFEGHKAVQMMLGQPIDDFVPYLERPDHPMAIERDSDTRNPSYATYHGPSYLIAEMSFAVEVKMIVCHTPIDQTKLQMWGGVMMKSDDPMVRDNAHEIETGYLYGLKQDIHIWENKEKIDHPMVCDGDGPIMAAREWYAQFYKPRSKYTEPERKDYGDKVERFDVLSPVA